MCHLWGEQRCSPFFYTCRKAGELRRIRLPPCFPAGEGEAPFCGQKLRPPPRHLLAKKLFPGLSCVRRSPCDIRKNVRMLTKKIRFIHLVASYTRRALKGLRGVIGDVCLMPVPGPSPKSSAISFRVVTLTRLTPKIKKAAGTLPQPWYLVMASGHLRLIHARNGRQNARYRLRPGNSPVWTSTISSGCAEALLSRCMVFWGM